jgi:IclR family pca regulon transcriptional regulator
MGKVMLAYADPRTVNAFFAGRRLEAMTRATICDEQLLRHSLDEVRKQGWAMADQESEDGIRSVAAPVWNRQARVVAAMNVSAHATRVSQEELCDRYLPVLLDAVHGVSRALGARHLPVRFFEIRTVASQ